LIASKTSATAVRGKYYGIAAAFGKVGAFIGSKTLIILYNHYAENEPIKAGQYPFFIASALCIFSAALALFALPHISQESIEEEDARFRIYLEGHGAFNTRWKVNLNDVASASLFEISSLSSSYV
jgi:hypothetical protein